MTIVSCDRSYMTIVSCDSTLLILIMAGITVNNMAGYIAEGRVDSQQLPQ